MTTSTLTSIKESLKPGLMQTASISSVNYQVEALQEPIIGLVSMNTTGVGSLIKLRGNGEVIVSATTGSIVIKREFHIPPPEARPGTTSLEDVIDELSEDDEEFIALMKEMRQEAARELHSSQAPTMSSLRLAAGLSQKELAEKIQSSQSYIAKIEAGRNDPSTDAIEKIALALSVNSEVLFTAIRNQRTQ